METRTQGIDPAVIRSTQLLSDLDDGDMGAIAKSAQLLNIAKGERLFGRGEPVEGLYLVRRGDIKLYVLSSTGTERIVRLVNANGLFGESAALSGRPSHLYAESLSPAELLFIPVDTALQQLDRNGGFGQRLLFRIGKLVQDLELDIEACSLMNAQERAAAYLLRLFGDGRRDRPARAVLPASRWVIASLLNMSGETFSRQLRQFERDSLIRVDRRSIELLDPVGLSKQCDIPHADQTIGHLGWS
jgi:CRP-like cAMP-binding protein